MLFKIILKIAIDTVFNKLYSLRGFKLYTLNGGLGDCMQLIDYISKNKQKEEKIIVAYFDTQKETQDVKSFNYGQSRKLSDNDGNLINPIREFLLHWERKGVIAAVVPHDIRQSTLGTRLYCEIVNRFSDYDRDSVLTEYCSDTQRYEEICTKLKITPNRYICVHLRRNSQQIIDALSAVAHKKKIPQVVILGSSENQLLPDIPENLDTISLIDSYKRGFNLRDVLTVLYFSNLFIGGRGGFEYFGLRVRDKNVLTLFDDDGFGEIERGWWKRELWSGHQKVLVRESATSSEQLSNIIYDLI